ncbi:MFS transporter [Corynebacterium mayonis]|uniref:MFS transporter n=1 Tax=Corynebacterium mayonis TaxID=3062461 RepID=UPI0031401E87
MPMINRLRYLCIMIGGFLGPFAGQSLAVVLPEFAADFGISLHLASLTMTAYLLPFAIMMLFSTYLVRQRSPSHVVRVAYAVIAVASVALVFSPVWWVFLVAYVLAALSNAFTAPLLQLVLRHITPDNQLGKALGTYAAMQSFGMFSAPLVAGATVSVGSWRWMYVLLLVFAVLIVGVGLPYVPPPGSARGPRVLSWRALRGCLTLLSIGVGVIGLSFLVALHVGTLFDAPPLTRGFIVMFGGLSAFLLARPVGALADRFGLRPVVVVSLLVAAVGVCGVALSPWMAAIAVLWGVAVLAAQGVQVGVNMLVLSTPGGGQMLSTIQSFRFFGSALTPIVILPLYTASPLLAFGAAAVVLCAAAALNITELRR